MRKLDYKSGTGIGLTLLSPAVLAATLEEELTTVIKVSMYAFIVFVVVVIVGVYFMRSRDKRLAPLNRIFEEGEAIHSVGPDTAVTECVRLMTAEKIGAVVVMDGERLKGIFTERDALNKVLAAGLDPGSTKVSEVMTKDPHCIPPTTTVGDAMELITKRRLAPPDCGKRKVARRRIERRSNSLADKGPDGRGSRVVGLAARF
jgi:CBS domain-containing protein